MAGMLQQYLCSALLDLWMQYCSSALAEDLASQTGDERQEKWLFFHQPPPLKWLLPKLFDHVTVTYSAFIIVSPLDLKLNKYIIPSLWQFHWHHLLPFHHKWKTILPQEPKWWKNQSYICQTSKFKMSTLPLRELQQQGDNVIEKSWQCTGRE